MKGQMTNPKPGMPRRGLLSRSILFSLVIVLAISLGGVRADLSEAGSDDPGLFTWSTLTGPILRSATGSPVRQIEARDADGDGFPELFALISGTDSSLTSTTLAAYGFNSEGCKGAGCPFGQIAVRSFEGVSFHNLSGPASPGIQQRAGGTGQVLFHSPVDLAAQTTVLAGEGLSFVVTRNGRSGERSLHRVVFDGQSGTFGDAAVMDGSRFPSNQLCKLAKPGQLGGKPGVYWLAYSDYSNAPCDFWPAGNGSATNARDLYWQEVDEAGMLVPGTKVRLMRGTTARALAMGDLYVDLAAGENDPEIFLLEGSVGSESIGVYQVRREGSGLAGVEVCTLGKTRGDQSTRGLMDMAVGWLNGDQRVDIVGIKSVGGAGGTRSSQLATWTMREDWVSGMPMAGCGGIFAYEEQVIPEALNQNSRIALYSSLESNYLFVNVPAADLSGSETYLHTSQRPEYRTLPVPTLEVMPVVVSQDGQVRPAVQIQIGNLPPGADVEVRRSTQGVEYCALTIPHETTPCDAEEEGVLCRLDENVLSNQQYSYCIRSVAQNMAPSAVVHGSAQTLDVAGGCPVEVGPVIPTTWVWTSQYNGVDQEPVVNSPFVQSGVEFVDVLGRFTFQSAVRFDLRGVNYPTPGAVLDDVILRLKGTGTGWDQSWGAPFEIGVWDTDNDASLWAAPSATAILRTRYSYVDETWKLQPYSLYWGQVFQENHHVAEDKVNRLRFRDPYQPDEFRQYRLRFVDDILRGPTSGTTMTIIIQRPNATGLVDSIRPGQNKWAKWGSYFQDPNRGDPYDFMPQLIFQFKTCPG